MYQETPGKGKAKQKVNGNALAALKRAVENDNREVINTLFEHIVNQIETSNQKQRMDFEFLLNWADKNNRLDIIHEILKHNMSIRDQNVPNYMLVNTRHSEFINRWGKNKEIDKLVICLQTGAANLDLLFKLLPEQTTINKILIAWLETLKPDARAKQIKRILKNAASHGFIEVLRHFMSENFMSDKQKKEGLERTLLKAALEGKNTNKNSNYMATVEFLSSNSNMDISKILSYIFLIINNYKAIPKDFNRVLTYLYEYAIKERKENAVEYIEKFINGFDKEKINIRNLCLLKELLLFLDSIKFTDSEQIDRRNRLFLKSYRTILNRGVEFSILHDRAPAIIASEIIYFLHKRNIRVNPNGYDIDLSASYQNLDKLHNNDFYRVCHGLHLIYGCSYDKADIQARIPQLYVQQKIDEKKNTRLHIPKFNSNIESVQELIKAGAVVNLQNNDGETPIDTATNIEVKMLLTFVDIMQSKSHEDLSDFLTKNKNWMLDQLDNMQDESCLKDSIVHASTKKVKILRDFFKAHIKAKTQVNDQSDSRQQTNTTRTRNYDFLNKLLKTHIATREEFCHDIAELIKNSKSSWFKSLIMTSYNNKESALNNLYTSISYESDENISGIIKSWKEKTIPGNDHCNNQVIKTHRNSFFNLNRSKITHTANVIHNMEQKAARMKL